MPFIDDIRRHELDMLIAMTGGTVKNRNELNYVIGKLKLKRFEIKAMK